MLRGDELRAPSRSSRRSGAPVARSRTWSGASSTPGTTSTWSESGSRPGVRGGQQVEEREPDHEREEERHADQADRRGDRVDDWAEVIPLVPDGDQLLGDVPLVQLR